MASRRRLRRLSCEGKKRHNSQHEALESVRRTTRKIHARNTLVAGRDADLHAYHCPHCGCWHVGHRMNANPATGRSKGHG